MTAVQGPKGGSWDVDLNSFPLNRNIIKTGVIVEVHRLMKFGKEETHRCSFRCKNTVCHTIDIVHNRNPLEDAVSSPLELPITYKS